MTNAKEFFGAIQAGELATVAALFDAEPSLAGARNEQGQSPILFAIYTGRKDIRDLLLSRGVGLEFHEAAAAGHLGRVKTMVEKDPLLAGSYSPDGFPILGLAAVFGHRGVAKYLLSRGADVNATARNATGYTPLTGAVAGGHAEVVALLIAHGANINHRYGNGFSPLLTAAANGHLEIVKLLLEHGADLHARTDDNQNALSLAIARGHHGVADFLRQRGAAV